jgi:hypothetical protein
MSCAPCSGPRTYSPRAPTYAIPNATKLVDDSLSGGGLQGRYARAMNTLPFNAAHQAVVANTEIDNQRLSREMDDVWQTTIKSKCDARNFEHANSFISNFWPSTYPAQQPWQGQDLQIDGRNSAYNYTTSPSLLVARARGFQ